MLSNDAKPGAPQRPRPGPDVSESYEPAIQCYCAFCMTPHAYGEHATALFDASQRFCVSPSDQGQCCVAGVLAGRFAPPACGRRLGDCRAGPRAAEYPDSQRVHRHKLSESAAPRRASARAEVRPACPTRASPIESEPAARSGTPRPVDRRHAGAWAAGSIITQPRLPHTVPA